MKDSLISTELQQVLSRFRFEKKLGEGAQKVVYLAIAQDECRYAVKVGRFRSKSAYERISREVALLKEIESPGIAQVLDFFIDEKSREFVIIEKFYNGRHLGDCKLLFLDPNRVISFILSSFKILDPIWSKQIVHRDLKPQNIIIGRDYMPTIIDFGIARFLDQTSLTATSASRGPCTPIYAAREQLTNRKVTIDRRTDFFALAVIAAELVGGIHPFSPDAVGNDQDIEENIIEGIFALPEIALSGNSELKTFLNKCMQPEPYLRYRDTNDALRGLQSFNL